MLNAFCKNEKSLLNILNLLWKNNFVKIKSNLENQKQKNLTKLKTQISKTKNRKFFLLI